MSDKKHGRHVILQHLLAIDKLQKQRCDRLCWVLHFAIKFTVGKITYWLVLRKKISTDHISIVDIIMVGKASQEEKELTQKYQEIVDKNFSSFEDLQAEETQFYVDGETCEVEWFRYKKVGTE